MKKVYLAFVALLIACLAASSAAQDALKFRDYMDAAATVDHFSGTVLVARRGHVIFQQAYGLADRAKNTSNTVATKYWIGSMSKPLTAVAVMALRDQGKIKLDDSICVYLAPCPDAWKSIKLTNLLTHSSGVADIVKFSDFMTFRAQPHTPQQLLELIASHPVTFEPGKKFEYSNSNFILLGAVIEKVTGKPYALFMKKTVFDPAGMKATGYDEKPPAGAAIGYVRDGENLRPADETAMSVRFSAGGLYSTVADLLSLNRALEAGKILKPATVQEMWTDRGNGYAYGWIPGEDEKKRHSVGHSGRIDGFASSMRLYPDEDLFIVVLSNMNGTNTERMTAVLSAIAHGEPFNMPRERKFITVAATKLAEYDGKYRLPWGLVLIVTHDGDHLFGRAEQEKKPTEWKAESESVFYVPPAELNIEFVKEKGKLTLVFDGNAKAEKVE